jgi:homoserine dehydrogenase
LNAELGPELGIGVAGLGTVGVGVLKLLEANGGILAQRCGRRIRVAAVSARDRDRDRGVDISQATWYDSAEGMASDSAVDVVIELIGGEDGPAKALVEAAIANGKSVVTANKALIARHGNALARAAEAKGVSLSFEAAVAGGIPIVKVLRESFAGNRLNRIYGILNGTCNFILTQMEESAADFAEVLAEAQRLGYAEADPGFDVDGIDAAHKLAILASVSFGRPVDFDSVHIEGIRQISALDIAYARELGYRIKLLGIAGLTDHGVEQRVHPCMVPEDSPIAHVAGVYNAVVVEGDFVGRAVFEAMGAGAGPTASAVIGDLTDIARGQRVPTFGVAADSFHTLPAAPMPRHRGPYYLRLKVLDQPGVMADISAILRDHEVSIESVLQRGRSPDDAVSVIMTMHETEEAAMVASLVDIKNLSSVLEPPCMIRIEHF